MKIDGQKINRIKKILSYFNLLLGIFLWFLYFSSYSIRGPFSELIYPLIIWAIAHSSYKFVQTGNVNEKDRKLYKKLHRLSILGGKLSLLAIFPPMLFFTVPIVECRVNNPIYEQVASPDGNHVITIYTECLGFEGMPNWYLFKVSSTNFPYIEKVIDYGFGDDNFICSTGISSCIEWVDNENIRLIGFNSIRNINGFLPWFPLWAISSYVTLILFIPKLATFTRPF